jgi:hypothetical protein
MAVMSELSAPEQGKCGRNTQSGLRLILDSARVKENRAAIAGKAKNPLALASVPG